MNLLTPARLAVMMFLQFFIWGAWYVTGPAYLGSIGFGPGDFAWTYSVGPIAGLISPFIVGMIADRFFATERVLGILHLIGGATMFGAISLMQVDKPSPYAINMVFFAYMLTYFPTLSLSSSLLLHNLVDAEKQFPRVRMFGTLGWIAAGAVINYLIGRSSINQFYLAAGGSLCLGVYSFMLPHTPPPSKGKAVSARELLGLDAFILLKQPAFLAFMVCSFLICIPLAFYYQMAERSIAQGGVGNPAFTMTYGQMSEAFFMLVMPVFFAFLGVKWMLFVGMLAWVVRYALFAFGAPVPPGETTGVIWMLLAGVILHGICYDYFFVTGQIYTDRVAPKEIRSQAQGMLVLFTLGIGMLIGAQCAGFVEGYFTGEKSLALQKRSEAVGKAADKLSASLAKRLPKDEASREQIIDMAADEKSTKEFVEDAADEEASPGALAASALAAAKKSLGDENPIGAAEQIATQRQVDYLNALKNDLANRSAQAKDWKSIWGIPAIFAAVVMVLFAIVFHDKRPAEAAQGKGAATARDAYPEMK